MKAEGVVLDASPLIVLCRAGLVDLLPQLFPPLEASAPMAYTGFVTAVPVTVVEVEPFPTKAGEVWTEEERLEFITFIAEHPRAGDVIPGSGGVRKVRWGRAGIGKRGGVRVVYYFHDERMPLFLLTVYAKGRKEDLSPREVNVMRRIASELRSSYGSD